MIAISAGHQKTLEAAQEILHQGGNAVDAAIAAYWVSFVSEPCMASAGAGGFAQVMMDGQIFNLDFFCQTPKRARPPQELDFYPIVVDFGVDTETFYIGKGSSAVPGAISGIYALHQRWGSMPMSELVAQAIEAAKHGVKLDRFQAMDLGLLESIFVEHPKGRELFFNERTLKKEGDPIVMAGFADFLDVLSKEGQDLFYKGEIARQIETDYAHNGLITREDLEGYSSIISKPYSFSYCNNTIHTTRFPSSGGVIIAAILKSMEETNLHFEDKKYGQELKELLLRVKKSAKSINVLAQELSDKYGLGSPVGQSRVSGFQSKGTSHFSIVDGNGNAVGLTTSIGEGNGYFIPGTDMQMNNMLGEAALLPEGFHNWRPDTRLTSMMTPTLVTDENNNLKMVIGSGGAGRIPYAIAQTINYHIQQKLSIRASVESPRMYFDDHTLHLEAGLDVPSGDHETKVWYEPSLFFGGTNVVALEHNHCIAIADQRRYGVATD